MAVITLPITEARAKFLELVKKAGSVFERFIVTKKGRPEAVVMSYDEYEGWLETLDIMSDPQLAKGIKEAQEDVKKGRIYSFEEVIGKPQKGIKKPHKKR